MVTHERTFASLLYWELNIRTTSPAQGKYPYDRWKHDTIFLKKWTKYPQNIIHGVYTPLKKLKVLTRIWAT